MKTYPNAQYPSLLERIMGALFPVKDIVKSPNGQTLLYLRRFIIKKPTEKKSGIFLHKIYRSDDDRDPHDHPFGFTSLILSGGYVDEHYTFKYERGTSEPPWEQDIDGRHTAPITMTRPGYRVGPFYEEVKPFRIYKRAAAHTHRVQLHPNTTAWTLVFTTALTKPWHFFTRTTRVWWRDYLNEWGQEILD